MGPRLIKVIIWANAFIVFLVFPVFMIAFLWCLKDEWGKENFLSGGYK